jgi:hypothetical protein
MATQCNSNHCSSVIAQLIKRIETLESIVAAHSEIKVDNGKDPLKDTLTVQVNELHSRVSESWSEVVKKSKKTRVRAKSDSTVLTKNRFECLFPESETKSMEESDCENDKKVIVIGDSNVRRLETPIINRIKRENAKKVTILRRSGARIADCESILLAALKEECVAKKVKVFVHVGTNDVERCGSEVLLNKLRNMIKAARNLRAGVDMTICSIPSRVDKGGHVFSRSESINFRLTKLCREEGATFLDLSHQLRKCRFPLGRDGVHYSWKGAQVVGSLIGEVASCFLK